MTKKKEKGLCSDEPTLVFKVYVKGDNNEWLNRQISASPAVYTLDKSAGGVHNEVEKSHSSSSSANFITFKSYPSLTSTGY